MNFPDGWRVKRTYFWSSLFFCLFFAALGCFTTFFTFKVETPQWIFAAVIALLLVPTFWGIIYSFLIGRLENKYPLIFREHKNAMVYFKRSAEEAKIGMPSEVEWKISPRNVEFRHLKIDFGFILKSWECSLSAKIFSNPDFCVDASFGYSLNYGVTPKIFCANYKSDAELHRFLEKTAMEVILEISKKIFCFQNGIISYKNSLSTKLAATNMARLLGTEMNEKIKGKDGSSSINIYANGFRWPGND